MPEPEWVCSEPETGKVAEYLRLDKTVLSVDVGNRYFYDFNIFKRSIFFIFEHLLSVV